MEERGFKGEKSTSCANIVFKRKNAYLDAKVSSFFFLLQGIKAHTHKLFICVTVSLCNIYIAHSHVFTLGEKYVHAAEARLKRV